MRRQRQLKGRCSIDENAEQKLRQFRPLTPTLSPFGGEKGSGLLLETSSNLGIFSGNPGLRSRLLHKFEGWTAFVPPIIA